MLLGSHQAKRQLRNGVRAERVPLNVFVFSVFKVWICDVFKDAVLQRRPFILVWFVGPLLHKRDRFCLIE